MLIPSKSTAVRSWDPWEWHQLYLAYTELTKERWNTRIKKEMNDWLAIYRRQNVSVGRLDIPSAIFAFNGVLPKRLSLQHITCASWGVSICKWHITPERQSYYSLYSAINTLASHFTSYGAILKTFVAKHMSTCLDVFKKTKILSNQNDITVVTGEGPKFPFPNKRRPRFFELCQQVATGSHWMTASLRYCDVSRFLSAYTLLYDRYQKTG